MKMYSSDYLLLCRIVFEGLPPQSRLLSGCGRLFVIRYKYPLSNLLTTCLHDTIQFVRPMTSNAYIIFQCREAAV